MLKIRSILGNILWLKGFDALTMWFFRRFIIEIYCKSVTKPLFMRHKTKCTGSRHQFTTSGNGAFYLDTVYRIDFESNQREKHKNHS